MLTEAIFNKVIKGVSIAVICKLIVSFGKLLKALGSNGGEISGEVGVLGKNHGGSGYKTVDQRLLPNGDDDDYNALEEMKESDPVLKGDFGFSKLSVEEGFTL
ncbi:hypothetical protein L1987_28570 [Smallanthus sonchifolius]|uniref:Uncharacterized protein n=1 Tax=Smallanthus sonchifolius TaxID=185202 RepID=A0ACB9HXL4_9ASTR|nr:hypothetical protein L1987_28570 [Smallanthus sonchifolius]